jgi:uncharacterized protein (TIGR02246 family)
MQKDEHAIRALIEQWLDASIKGDLETVLGLMDEDAIFMTPGAEPFDREAFKAMHDSMKGARMEGTVETHELRVLGDWAYARNYLDLVFFPPQGGAGTKRRGFTLTIFRKDSHGNWLLHRDANLVMPDKA